MGIVHYHATACLELDYIPGQRIPVINQGIPIRVKCNANENKRIRRPNDLRELLHGGYHRVVVQRILEHRPGSSDSLIFPLAVLNRLRLSNIRGCIRSGQGGTHHWSLVTR